jgi:hypothetical protein
MADVTSCIEKLVASGQVTRAIADEALEAFKRSKAEYSYARGPASADAAAAQVAAKAMRDKAAEKQIAIAASVKTWRELETRIAAGKNVNESVMATLTKTARGDATRGENIDYKGKAIKDWLFGMLGPEMEKFKTGFFKDNQLLTSATNFIKERFGVDTGDQLAKAVSNGFQKVIDEGSARAKAAGKIFSELEDWRLPQHWSPSRVAQLDDAARKLGQRGQDEYVRDHLNEIASGGLKLFDKETNRYATADQYSEMLKKAWSDIKTQGADDGPFSKNMRTFEFQPGQEGANSWLKLQGKYGVGNEIMGAVDQHVNNMARTIALNEIYGPNPDATFAALMRKVNEGPGSSLVKGTRWLDSSRALQLTYDNLSGRGNPIANEAYARFWSGARDVVGVASLRNLPITIIPGDTAMSFMSANFNGMSGFDILGHVFDGKMTREVAQHLQVSANGYGEFINNSVRRYEDQLNVSGMIRKVSRQIVKATGADWWTTNGRLGAQISYLHTLQAETGKSFANLTPDLRENFLGRYGFTADEWERMRNVEPWQAPNGAKYLDVTKIDRPLSERLMAAIKEQSAFAFHQPDARTQAIMRGGAQAGSVGGELQLMLGQYKQFTMERMTTHLMRIFTDGPIENRVARGLAFTALSMAAGAVSLQAAAVVTGKDPLDMKSPKFWVEAFARGGAGGIYGDVLGAAIHGDRGPASIVGQMAGPVPGMGADMFSAAFAPLRQALDESGRPIKGSFAKEAVQGLQRHSPNTFYAKLAIDRLFWEKLQVLVDPNYRQSFRRAEQNAKKQGSGYWWGPGEPAPSRAPNLSTAINR